LLKTLSSLPPIDRAKEHAAFAIAPLQSMRGFFLRLFRGDDGFRPLRHRIICD
jgi:hypothetical protein